MAHQPPGSASPKQPAQGLVAAPDRNSSRGASPRGTLESTPEGRTVMTPVCGRPPRAGTAGAPPGARRQPMRPLRWLGVLWALSLAACGGGGTDSNRETVLVEVTSVPSGRAVA